MLKNFLKIFAEGYKNSTDPIEKSVYRAIRSREQAPIWIVSAGKTGVGKSSLFNKIFKPTPKLKEGRGKAGTLSATTQEIDLGEDRGTLKYTDLPGIGESLEKNEEVYDAIIKTLEECDLIIWLFKCDDTSKDSEQLFYNKLSKEIKSKIIVGLSKIDQASGNWNFKQNSPSKDQIDFILNRIEDISETFGFNENEIIDFSVKMDYQVHLLLRKMMIKIKGKGDILRNKVDEDFEFQDTSKNIVDAL